MKTLLKKVITFLLIPCLMVSYFTVFASADETPESGLMTAEEIIEWYLTDGNVPAESEEAYDRLFKSLMKIQHEDDIEIDSIIVTAILLPILTGILGNAANQLLNPGLEWAGKKAWGLIGLPNEQQDQAAEMQKMMDAIWKKLSEISNLIKKESLKNQLEYKIREFSAVYYNTKNKMIQFDGAYTFEQQKKALDEWYNTKYREIDNMIDFIDYYAEVISNKTGGLIGVQDYFALYDLWGDQVYHWNTDAYAFSESMRTKDLQMFIQMSAMAKLWLASQMPQGISTDEANPVDTPEVPGDEDDPIDMPEVPSDEDVPIDIPDVPTDEDDSVDMPDIPTDEDDSVDMPDIPAISPDEIDPVLIARERKLDEAIQKVLDFAEAKKRYPSEFLKYNNMDTGEYFTIRAEAIRVPYFETTWNIANSLGYVVRDTKYFYQMHAALIKEAGSNLKHGGDFFIGQDIMSFLAETAEKDKMSIRDSLAMRGVYLQEGTFRVPVSESKFTHAFYTAGPALHHNKYDMRNMIFGTNRPTKESPGSNLRTVVMQSNEGPKQLKEMVGQVLYVNTANIQTMDHKNSLRREFFADFLVDGSAIWDGYFYAWPKNFCSTSSMPFIRQTKFGVPASPVFGYYNGGYQADTLFRKASFDHHVIGIIGHGDYNVGYRPYDTYLEGYEGRTGYTRDYRKGKG